jgi:formylmethanofuran--tetrahydromethanopterin N-formyltransferase
LKQKVEIEDTFAEAFEGLYCRITVTADDKKTLRKAAEDATATPAVVVGRTEGGIEKWLSRKESPDGRFGAVLQFWGAIEENKPFQEILQKFAKELSYRIRQDILVKPFTRVFDATEKAEGKIDMMEWVGHCGDGFEWEEKLYGRHMIVVPLMVPNFSIERYIGYARGVCGANFWYMCKTKEAVKKAGKKALEAIGQVEGVITPFDICSAGSKPETRFPSIGPTTNHPYCPSLKKVLGKESKVPDHVSYIPEIVINGVSLAAIKEAMKAGIKSIVEVENVVKISAGNYEGKLGKYKIYLRELFP